MAWFNPPRQASAPPKKRKAPQDAEAWRAEAEAAADEGDWTRAVVCYRRAMSLAPFCTDLRQDFEWAIEQQILRGGTSGKSSDSPRSEARMRPRFFADDDSPAAKGSPSRTEREVEEDFDELADLEDDEPARGTQRVRRPARNSQSSGRLVTLGIAAAIAIVLTGGALYGAAAASQYIRGLFAPESLPSLASTNTLPEELRSTLDEANKLMLTGKGDDAAVKLRAARSSHSGYEDAITPALAQALRAQGNSELRAGKYETAAKAFREATELDSQNALNWIDLGRTLRDHASSSSVRNQPARQRELLADAEKAFQRALDLSKNDSAALLGLAQVYKAGNNRQRAVETYEKLVAVAPSTSEGQIAEQALKQLKPR